MDAWALNTKDLPNAGLGNVSKNLCRRDDGGSAQEEVVEQFPASKTPQSVWIVFLILRREWCECFDRKEDRANIRYAFREEDFVNGTAPDLVSAFECYVAVPGCGVSRLERNTTNDYLLVCVDFLATIRKEADPGCSGSGSYSGMESGMSTFI